MKDNSGREINYLRISVTDRCNLRCQYCMPEEGVEKKEHSNILSFEDICKIVEACVKLGIDKIRLTGGEPLTRQGIVSLVEQISKIDGIKDLAMTTNGVLLKEYAEDLKKAGLKRVNISLDTMYGKKYEVVTRGGSIDDVFDGIDAANQAGLKPMGINTVMMKGFNDDEIMDFMQLTLNEDFNVRFIELMPFGQVLGKQNIEFLSNQEILNQFDSLQPVQSDSNTVAKYYKLPGGIGKIGFISAMSNHFCEECNKIRLTADGKLKPCLHTNEEIDLLPALKAKDPDLLLETIKNAILQKPEKHLLNENGKPIERSMNKIGG